MRKGFIKSGCGIFFNKIKFSFFYKNVNNKKECESGQTQKSV